MVTLDEWWNRRTQLASRRRLAPVIDECDMATDLNRM